MPYYKNAETLARSVASFAMQHQAGLCEIVIADDGDAPEAQALLAKQTFAIPIRYVNTCRSGQSGATNRGIELAAGSLVLLTCADIIAAPRLVAHHREAHRTASDDIAVQGFLPYAPWLAQTPFMRYLKRPGPQFSFETIDTPENIDPGHIYAPHLSVSRDALMRAGLFDEAFPYGFQDTDLGFRLRRVGTRLTYCSQAVGYHDHATNLRAFLRRQEKVGESLPRMMLTNWTLAQRLTVATRLRTIIAQMNREQAWLEAAEKIEAQIGMDARAFALAEQELCGLYTRLCTAAVVRGAFKCRAQLLEAAPSFADLFGEGGAAPMRSIPL